MKTLQALAGVLSVAAAIGVAYAAPVTIDLTSGINVAGNSASGSTGVTVSATVLPTLSMQLSTNSLALGDLPTTTSYTGSTINLEFGTNAANGLVATVDSANGGLKSTTLTGYTIGDTTNVGVGNESYQIITATGTSDVVLGGAASVGGTHNVTPLAKTGLAVYSTNKPEQADLVADAVVTVQARADTATPAANDYADSLTFTVTATF